MMRGAQAGRRPVVLLALALAGAAALPALPARAQWRAGQAVDPVATPHTEAGNLARYAQVVGAAAEWLRRMVTDVAAQAPADTQEGVMSRARMALLDQAQRAWVAVREVPPSLDDHAAYEAANQQFRASLTEMRTASTPTPEALAEARKILDAMARLERAAAEAARVAAR